MEVELSNLSKSELRTYILDVVLLSCEGGSFLANFFCNGCIMAKKNVEVCQLCMRLQQSRCLTAGMTATA